MLIVINGRQRKWHKERIGHAQLVALVYSKATAKQRRDYCPSVSFSRADQTPAEGIFNRRTSVKIKDGTRFNCTITSNA